MEKMGRMGKEEKKEIMAGMVFKVLPGLPD
jgi:hypothetical protein